ncbi:hypothetical protein [Rhizobium rhizogenes]|uniref:hypothetical protein n=1 Tax=Rhizobium rhizogenes TaxID=359 RepID=UPI0005A285DF
MDTNSLLARIEDLEAQLNGLLIYIAAKEVGITLDPDDQLTKDFLADNAVRPIERRQAEHRHPPGPITLAADGYWEALAAQAIPAISEKLRTHFK